MGPVVTSSLLDQLATMPVLAILRSGTGAYLGSAAAALVECGVTCVEVTVPTPGSADVVEDLSRMPGAYVGMGTVRSVSDLDTAVGAGARFVVSPHTDVDLIRAAVDRGLEAVPGAMTPSEVVAAVDAGATAVKLFPASHLGPGYLSALRAPLPDVPFIATGGIGLTDVGEWIAAGAVGFGVGSPLVGDAIETGGLEALRSRARAWVDGTRASVPQDES